MPSSVFFFLILSIQRNNNMSIGFEICRRQWNLPFVWVCVRAGVCAKQIMPNEIAIPKYGVNWMSPQHCNDLVCVWMMASKCVGLKRDNRNISIQLKPINERTRIENTLTHRYSLIQIFLSLSIKWTLSLQSKHFCSSILAISR